MTNNNLEIVELTSDQAALVSAKLTAEKNDYIKHFTPFDFSESTIQKILTNKKLDKYFGLFVSQELAGFYMLRGFDEGFQVPSYGVWISSEYKNKSLSTLTLYHAFSFCKLNSIKSLMLKVHPDNVIAKNLYEKMGFKKTGTDSKNKNLIYYKEIL
jgi:RimJ/RimL family protein N-acetyltransferase